jgi:hypothetical protein
MKDGNNFAVVRLNDTVHSTAANEIKADWLVTLVEERVIHIARDPLGAQFEGLE